MLGDGLASIFQHRLPPNLSRHLGVGRSFPLGGAGKPGRWRPGGRRRSVSGGGLIDRQAVHYGELPRYAGLPAAQETTWINTSGFPNLWNARIRTNQYLTVEDESNNMFEIKREFSTRAKNQGLSTSFQRNICSEITWRQPTASFSADPKAIPYIVAITRLPCAM